MFQQFNSVLDWYTLHSRVWESLNISFAESSTWARSRASHFPSNEEFTVNLLLRFLISSAKPPRIELVNMIFRLKKIYVKIWDRKS